MAARGRVDPPCATGIGPVLAAPWISLLDTAAQPQTDQGAVFGLIKYSPTPLIAVALRPEAVSKTCPVGLCCVCNQSGWVSAVHVLAGLELAETPGFVVPAIGAALGGLIYALIPKRII